MSPKYASSGEEWVVDEKSQTYQSPSKTKNWEQTLYFADDFRNATIDFELTLLDHLDDAARREGTKEALVLWRRNWRKDGDSWYGAGVGAFKAKYFVARRLGRDWQHLARDGSRSSLEWNRPLKLRIQCDDDRISFFEGDVPLLQVNDTALEQGQWGLRTWGTVARFKITKLVTRPKCFVIMPFAKEFDGVFNVIKATLREFGIHCTRADQSGVSVAIMQDVKRQIRNADLVIVDLTGKNPNVYYEAGLADAWDRDWIVLTQSAEDATFDMAQIRVIRYENRIGSDRDLATKLRHAVEATTGRSPVVPASGP